MIVFGSLIYHYLVYVHLYSTPSQFSEEIKYFPLSCAYILCDFDVLKVLKNSTFVVFQPNLEDVF